MDINTLNEANLSDARLSDEVLAKLLYFPRVKLLSATPSATNIALGNTFNSCCEKKEECITLLHSIALAYDNIRLHTFSLEGKLKVENLDARCRIDKSKVVIEEGKRAMERERGYIISSVFLDPFLKKKNQAIENSIEKLKAKEERELESIDNVEALTMKRCLPITEDIKKNEGLASQIKESMENISMAIEKANIRLLNVRLEIETTYGDIPFALICKSGLSESFKELDAGKGIPSPALSIESEFVSIFPYKKELTDWDFVNNEDKGKFADGMELHFFGVPAQGTFAVVKKSDWHIIPKITEELESIKKSFSESIDKLIQTASVIPDAL